MKIQFALNYAKAGYRVFPVVPNGRSPAFKGWQKQATTDSGQIEDLWEQNPEFNIGVLADQFIVLDIDQKNGKTGHSNLQEAVSNYGWTIPGGYQDVNTPSGGNHWYFRDPKPDKHSSYEGKPVLHCDIRAGGKGYAVGIGSVIDGIPYSSKELLKEITDLPEAPEWLCNAATSNTKHTAKSPTKITTSGIQEIDKIDPDLGRGDWIKTIWSALSVFGNTDETIASLREWSQQSYKWDEPDFERVVADYDSDKSFNGLPQIKNKYPNKAYYFSIPVDHGVADKHAGAIAKSTISFLSLHGNTLNFDHENAIHDMATSISYSYFAIEGKRTLIPAFTGIGKSQTVIAHANQILKPNFEYDKGLWISVATVEEIESIAQTLIDRGVSENLIGKKHSKNGSNVNQYNATGFKVIISTHERIRSCNHSYLTHYNGMPRQLVWDEALISTCTNYINLENLLDEISCWRGKYEMLTLQGKPSIQYHETKLYFDKLVQTLKNATDKSITTIPEHPSSLQLDIYPSATLEKLESGVSNEAYIDKGQHIFNWYISIPDEHKNIVIFDASGKHRKLQQFDSSIRIYPIQASKDYSDCTIHFCKANVGKHTMYDPVKNMPMFKEVAHAINDLFKDSSVVCFHLPNTDGVEPSPQRLGMILGDTSNIIFRSWGESKGINTLRDVQYGVHLGIIFRRDGELATAIAGQKRNTLHESTSGEVSAVQLSENVDQVYQAMNRLRCRQTDNGKAKQAEFLLFYNSDAILEPLKELMPNIQIKAYKPKYLERTNSAFETTHEIIQYLVNNKPSNISIQKLKEELDIDIPKSSPVWKDVKNRLRKHLPEVGYKYSKRSIVQGDKA